MRSLTQAYWAADTAHGVLEITTGDLLRRAAGDSPDQLAIVEIAPVGAPSLVGAERTDRTWTYAELLKEATACAQWLLCQFTPGERVAVWAPNIPEWIVLQYGAAMAGLVLVTANPAFRSRELRYVLERSQAAGVMYVDSFRGADMASVVTDLMTELPNLRVTLSFSDWDRQVRGYTGEHRQLPEVAPRGGAQIQYTSGTTGFPKGALLPHAGLVTNAHFIFLRMGFPSGGVWVTAVPLFHTAGCAVSVLGTAVTRSTYVLCQYFDPEMMLRALHDWHGDGMLGVPTMLIAMLDSPRFAEFDCSRCRVVLSGGAVVPGPLVRRVENAFGCRLSTVYGQTELCPIITQTRPDDTAEDKAETIGQPLWQVEVKIADPSTCETVGVDVEGEICARGYQTMLEYFDMPRESSYAKSDDGWLRTGDLGSMDSRGFVKILGRLKDMIIRGGENIFAREIEDLLMEHPKIAEVVVVGVPDDRMGEAVAAVVRPRKPSEAPSGQELHHFCREHLAAFKTPSYWYVTDEFPVTGSGKIQKFRIQESIAAGRLPELYKKPQ